MSQRAPTPKAEIMRTYRRHLAESGQHQLVVALPLETVAYLDEIKARDGLRSRNQALLKVIERERDTAR